MNQSLAIKMNWSHTANLNFNLAFLSMLSVNYSETHTIATAINQIIDKVLVKENLDFDIFIIGEQRSNFDEIASEILQMNSEKCSLEIYKKNHSKVVASYPEVTRSTVFLVTYQVFHFLTQSGFLSFNLSGSQPKKFVFYTEQTLEWLNDNQLERFMDANSYNFEMHKYFIINNVNRKSLTLKMNHVRNSSRGEGKKVQIISPITLNYFDKTKMKWNNNLADLKHRDTGLKNYYVHFSFSNPSKIFGYVDKNGSLKGALIDLFNIISEYEKFTPIYNFMAEHSFVANSVDLTPIQMFQVETTINILLENSLTGFIYSPMFIRESLRLIITPPELYTSYDKITMPFDLTTWLLLISTFVFAFFMIFILNHSSRRIQEIVYGDGEQISSYNIVSILFGIGQTKLPTSNLLRFILMLFILFCLIFQTAYQGVLYELITTDVQKPTPIKIAELIDQNYTFFQLRDSLRNMEMNFMLDKRHSYTSGL